MSWGSGQRDGERRNRTWKRKAGWMNDMVQLSVSVQSFCLVSLSFCNGDSGERKGCNLWTVAHEVGAECGKQVLSSSGEFRTNSNLVFQQAPVPLNPPCWEWSILHRWASLGGVYLPKRATETHREQGDGPDQIKASQVSWGGAAAVSSMLKETGHDTIYSHLHS